MGVKQKRKTAVALGVAASMFVTLFANIGTIPAKAAIATDRELVEKGAKYVQEYVDYIVNDGYELLTGDMMDEYSGENMDCEIAWTLTSGDAAIMDGRLVKTEKSAERQPIKLKAVVSKGNESKEVQFEHVTLLDEYIGYILSFFGGDDAQDQVHLGYSYDGLKWNRLNDSKTIIKTTIGNGKVRDPYIMRKKDGSFAVIATQGWDTQYIYLWDSEDLVSYQNERLVKVAERSDNIKLTGARAWAPEATYDPIKDEYVVYWSDPKYASDTYKCGGTYANTTKDLVEFSKPYLFFDVGYKNIDANILKWRGDYYMDFKGNNMGDCVGIQLAKADYIEPGTFKAYTGAFVSKTEKGDIEGPFMFQAIGEDRWYVYYDYYGSHKFGVSTTTNLNSDKWDYLGISETMPSERVQHGGVIPVTKKEMTRIVEAYDFGEKFLSVEAEYGELKNAEVKAEKNMSNGCYVGKLGEDNGTTTIKINSAKKEKRTLKVYYATKDERKLRVTVNGKEYTVTCPSTGDWTKLCEKPQTIEVDVNAGENIIQLGGVNGGAAPNVDRIEVEMEKISEARDTLQKMIDGLSLEALKASDAVKVNALKASYEILKLNADVDITRLDAALAKIAEEKSLKIEVEAGTLEPADKIKIVASEKCSNQHYVGEMGGDNGGTATFKVYAENAGSRNLSIYYATEQNRELNVKVNDGREVALDCKNVEKADWDVPESVPVMTQIDLKEGENTIELSAVKGSYAPNLDRIQVELSDAEAAKTVDSMIEKLPTAVTEQDKLWVEAVKASYEDLNDKAAVTKADVLNEALEQFAKIEEAKTALNKAVEDTREIYDAGQGNYTENSWEEFSKAYRAATDAETVKAASVEQLTKLTTELKDAKSALKEKEIQTPDETGDELEKAKNQLKEVVEQLENIYQAGQKEYTDDSWAKFKKLYEQALNPSEEATVQELQKLKEQLTEAKDTLEEKKAEDEQEKQLVKAKAELKAEVEEAKAIYNANQSDYTEESWNNFKAAYEEAEKAENAMTVKDIEDLKNNLLTAKASLIKKEPVTGTEEEEVQAARDALEAAVNTAKAVYEDGQKNYTDASWAEFETAYLKAGKADSEAAKNELVLLKDNLVAAQENLKEKTPEQKEPEVKPNPDTGVKPNENIGVVDGGNNSIRQTNTKVNVEKLEIVGKFTKIAAGRKIALTAKVLPENATDKTITWSSDDENYATVDAEGMVTTKKVKKKKTVTITATANDGSGKVAEYKIIVMPKAVKKVKLSAGSNQVKAGKKLRIRATVTPKASGKAINARLQWISSNPDYAVVNQKGMVTTKKAGKGKSVKITAMATDGTNKKAIIKIKIK